MNSVTKLLPLIFLLLCLNQIQAGSFDTLLKKQVTASGWVPSSEIYYNPEKNLAEVGKVFFETEKLSINGFISCRTCHRDEFGSADGLPVAAATGHYLLKKPGAGSIVGKERMQAGAKLLPRNTLAFWGRGAKGFDTFFWDGKVDFQNDKKDSQFGSKAPSEDSLVVAAHLPVVEIREMLSEDEFVVENKRESVDHAKKIFDKIANNLRNGEPEASKELANLVNKKTIDLSYTDYARAISSFIREEFKIKETKFEKYMLDKGKLDKDEQKGALIFYGKGSCVSCHSGAHFSDFDFHSVAFPQVGFGRNGFGVDYGRYNATFNPDDLYQFRTPPLYNVAKTAPYGHSGSIESLEKAIIAHFDPLRIIDVKNLDGYARHEFYNNYRKRAAAERVRYLSDKEVKQVAKFLEALSF